MAWWKISWLVQVALDLDIPFADAVSLVPMQLNPTKLTVPQSDRGDAFELSPPAATVRLSKKRSDLDAGTGGDCLDLPDRPDQIKSHAPIFARDPAGIKADIRAGALGEPDRRVRDPRTIPIPDTSRPGATISRRNRCRRRWPSRRASTAGYPRWLSILLRHINVPLQPRRFTLAPSRRLQADVSQT
jgi:hypothetical protein